MPETPNAEFWRDIKPVQRVFPPMPSRRSTSPMRRPRTSDTTCRSPRRCPASAVDLADRRTSGATSLAKSAGLVNRHYHPHQVFAYTISGKWGYLEHDWTATKGDFVYETPARATRSSPTSTTSR